jgi:hypothetical protein
MRGYGVAGSAPKVSSSLAYSFALCVRWGEGGTDQVAWKSMTCGLVVSGAA